MLERPLLAVALLVSSSSLAAAQTAVFTVSGDANADRLGTSVATAGDVDQDGFVDFIAGAPYSDSGADDAGMARVFSGRDGSVLLTFLGDSAEEGMGWFVTGLGDIDGDGFPDLFAGAPYADLTGFQLGVADVFSGKSGTLLYRFEGQADRDNLGTGATGTGDLDLDGFSDFAIGVPGQRTVRIYSGKNGSQLASFTGTHVSFGWTVGTTGDLDGDGKTDIIVGSPAPGIGAVTVISVGSGAVLFNPSGRLSGDEFGISAGGAGDVNGDGIPDFIVGAPVFYANHAGFVEVFSGKDGTVLSTFDGTKKTDDFGISVSDAGDLDQDGFADVIVGDRFDDPNGLRPGSIWVFSGRDGSVLYSTSGGRMDEFGTSVAHLGDLEGDGLPDFLVGSPAAGRNHHSVSGAVDLFSGKTCAARRLAYGEGWPGTLGVPVIGLGADPILCTTVGLELGNSLGQDTQAILFVGAAPAELPTAYGGTLLVLPLLALNLALPAPGASLAVAIPCDITLCGREVFLQMVVLDPGASQGVAFSPGLMLILGGTP